MSSSVLDTARANIVLKVEMVFGLCFNCCFVVLTHLYQTLWDSLSLLKLWVNAATHFTLKLSGAKHCVNKSGELLKKKTGRSLVPLIIHSKNRSF